MSSPSISVSQDNIASPLSSSTNIADVEARTGSTDSLPRFTGKGAAEMGRALSLGDKIKSGSDIVSTNHHSHNQS